MLAAVRHAELHNTGDLLSEAHASRAMNAARHLFGGNQRSHAFAKYDALWFGVPTFRRAVSDGKVLQLALASLIANRAIKRMVDQEELHHRVLRLLRIRRLGARDHTFGDRCRACRRRLWRFLDFA